MLARKTVLVVVALLVAIPVGMAWGAPFANVSIEARIAGSGAEYSSLVPVTLAGTPLEYRIMFQMADLSGGPVNNATAGGKVLSSLVAGTDGANSLKFNVYETATAPIQVDFAVAASLAAGWADAAGFSGGTVTARGNGANNLMNLRPIRGSGIFAGVTAVQIAGGVANVLDVVPGMTDSIITGAHMLPVPSSGSIYSTIKINGGSVLSQTNAASANTDPYIGYKALVLYTPFATSGIEGVPAGGFEVNQGEALVLDATGGGHAGVGATYQWTINSPALVLHGQNVTVPWADLLALGYGDHTIMLDVNTADGAHSSSQAGLTILPEPTTMALLAVGAVALIRRRRTA